MRILLAGESRFANEISSAFLDEGVETKQVKSAEDLKGPDYSTPVLLLDDPVLPEVLISEAALDTAIKDLKAGNYAVFLLDLEQDAAPYVERLVLKAASYVAAKKRNTIVLFRSSRANDEGFDEAYRKARTLGVTFYKYENLRITRDEKTYMVSFFDGKNDVSIKADLYVDCKAVPSSKTMGFAKVFRLHEFEAGWYSGTRWFMQDGETTKRNIRLLNTLEANVDGDTKEVVSKLAKEFKAMKEPAQERVAFVDSKKCAFCYTCYRVCSHAALGPDKDASAMKADELLCQGCGLCLSICPASAITFKGEDQGEKPTGPESGLTVFCCENSAYAAASAMAFPPGVLIEKISCGGEINSGLLTQALKNDGRILIAVCTDDGCKHIDGNKRAKNVKDFYRERIVALGLDADRIHFVKLGATMTAVLADAAVDAMTGGAIE